MFASTELARRIERTDASLCTDIADIVKRRRPDAGVYVEAFSGGAAVFAGSDSPVNKLIGAGFDGPMDAAVLDRIEREFTARGARLQAEISTLADPEFHKQLCSRGYVLSGFENVLGRSLANMSEQSNIDEQDMPHIETVAPNEVSTWASMLVDGFERPDTQGVASDQMPPREVIEQVMGDMLALESLRRYAIRIEGRMVAGASLRMDHGVAHFTGSATVDGFRRRGYQTAFAQARLRDAAANGCDIATVTTSPGTKSQENLQKQGFELLYSRALLVRS